jgi:hypothetical protein
MYSVTKADTKASESAVPSQEKVWNFAAVYAAQWTYYVIQQEKEIRKNGSLKNWVQYPFDPHHDLDSFHYNLVRHTLTGQYYYLFYRSRLYSKQDSFLWSVISSLAYEFTIETVTERPSYQDVYQTPAFGSALGIGAENLSLYLHEKDMWYTHLLAYILNPFSLLPPTKKIIAAVYPDPNNFVVSIGWEF